MNTAQRKLRIGLIFGGRSAEHEVSLTSASSVMTFLDRDKYEVIPIGITKEGEWLSCMESNKLLAVEQCIRGDDMIPLSMQSLNDVFLPQNLSSVFKRQPERTREKLDVAFPVMHGTYGEDGTLQGLLEMADVPYVGCGVLGSALGMDKEKMKMIFRSVGLPVVDSLTYRRHQWECSIENILDTVGQCLQYPCFIKPARLGSSIGVSKARNRSEVEQGIRTASEYDNKVVIEQGINCRELSCSVLGNSNPKASTIGEVMVGNDYYDYQAKYIDKKSYTVVPANIPQNTAELIGSMAIEAFLALELSGLARVDFFLEHETGHIYINEVNTMPSFTPECMYPKLCEANGLPYSLLLDRLIELAIERHSQRQCSRAYSSPSTEVLGEEHAPSNRY